MNFANSPQPEAANYPAESLSAFLLEHWAQDHIEDIFRADVKLVYFHKPGGCSFHVPVEFCAPDFAACPGLVAFAPYFQALRVIRGELEVVFLGIGGDVVPDTQGADEYAVRRAVFEFFEALF